MKQIPDDLLQTGMAPNSGYTKAFFVEDWCIASLSCFDRTRPELFEKVERHLLTHEVFVLTEGNAYLIICEGDEIPGQVYVVSMEKGKPYNIPPKVWHHVVMSEEARIILFEKSDTSAENSSYYHFDADQVRKIKSMLNLY